MASLKDYLARWQQTQPLGWAHQKSAEAVAKEWLSDARFWLVQHQVCGVVSAPNANTIQAFVQQALPYGMGAELQVLTSALKLVCAKTRKAQFGALGSMGIGAVLLARVRK